MINALLNIYIYQITRLLSIYSQASCGQPGMRAKSFWANCKALRTHMLRPWRRSRPRWEPVCECVCVCVVAIVRAHLEVRGGRWRLKDGITAIFVREQYNICKGTVLGWQNSAIFWNPIRVIRNQKNPWNQKSKKIPGIESFPRIYIFLDKVIGTVADVLFANEREVLVAANMVLKSKLKVCIVVG